MKRVFLLVLDGFGIGEAPDAAAFGDVGANTKASITKSPFFEMKTLHTAGFGNIDGVHIPSMERFPIASVGRMTEKSAGKDTTIGHWEIAGLYSPAPMPTFPEGFPQEVLDAFSKATGRGVLCNKPYSGTQVIADYGEEHLKTGDLIVYTSADSVFQIAAHEDLVPPEQLYEYCRMARKILTGPYAVGRVIARPFVGTPGNFARTANRRDFSLEPTGKTLLDAVREAGLDVISVGKIYDIFAGRGITEYHLTHGNAEGMRKTQEMLQKDFHGLCFINLVDTDMLYGHRNDVDGFARAIAEFDAWLPGFLAGMREDDCLMITADHGCDPGDVSTDHTREYTPLVIFGQKIRPINLGTRSSFADIAATVAEMLDVPYQTVGRSFYRVIQ